MGLKHFRILILTIAAASQMSFAEEVVYSRERYDLIVDRSPFGEDPSLAQEADSEAKKAAQEEAAALAAAKALEKQLRLCFLLETDSGEIRAGFQNLQAKKGDPRSVMLMVGENYQGMKLTKIDLPNSSATLMHNGQPVTFELTKANPKAQPIAAAAPATPQPPDRRFGGGFRRRTEPEQQPAPPQPPPEPALSPEEQEQRREEIRENLRQYQMEVIRAGMPPLPIPLTQEMDDQLVSEGVLPPSE